MAVEQDFDQDWDTDVQEQDNFNKSNFQTSSDPFPGDFEAPVKATKISTFPQITSPASASVSDLAPKPAKLTPEPKVSVQARKPSNLNISRRPSNNVFAVDPVSGKRLGKSRQLSFNKLNLMSDAAVDADARQADVEKKQAKTFMARPTKLNDSSKFANRYSPEVQEFFTRMNKKSFTEQAVEYLNAYWDEVGDQAEFIFTVAHRVFREADMHRQGISLYYLYEEGSDVDYPTYLYFYEKLCKFVDDNPEWRKSPYEKSAVYEVKTAITHKNELKEKVDVNFDGRVSFLEFLIYQYNQFSNPAGFMERAKRAGEEHPAVLEARLALEKVNERIKAYEKERARLEELAQQPGVKGLAFQHQLKVFDKSSLGEELQQALITAEAAVRLAVKKFQGGVGMGAAAGTPRGALWWMQRDLAEKKRNAPNKRK